MLANYWGWTHAQWIFLECFQLKSRTQYTRKRSTSGHKLFWWPRIWAKHLLTWQEVNFCFLFNYLPAFIQSPRCEKVTSIVVCWQMSFMWWKDIDLTYGGWFFIVVITRGWCMAGRVGSNTSAWYSLHSLNWALHTHTSAHTFTL